MAKRHGFFKDENGKRNCRFGIWAIFGPFLRGPYARLSSEGRNRGLTVEKPLFIEFHFRKSLYRFLHSLEHLQKHIIRWSKLLAVEDFPGPYPSLVFDIPLEAGIAADSVFHYLNLINDDLAKGVPFILSHNPPVSEEVESFSELKKQILDARNDVPTELKDLFVELDQEQSWWSLGFQRGQGIRQRLVHYCDLILFQGRGGEENGQMVPEISLASVGEGVRFPVFETTLREVLKDYCEWLDRFEQIIIRVFSKRMADQDVEWDWSSHDIPELALPIICPIANEGSSDSEQENDLYLPLLDTQ